MFKFLHYITHKMFSIYWAKQRKVTSKKKELTLNRKLPLSSAAFCAYSQTGRRRPTADAGLLAIVSLLSTANIQSSATDLHHANDVPTNSQLTTLDKLLGLTFGV